MTLIVATLLTAGESADKAFDLIAGDHRKHHNGNKGKGYKTENCVCVLVHWSVLFLIKFLVLLALIIL